MVVVEGSSFQSVVELNVFALMQVFTVVPWLLCTIFFSGLHWTYRRDKQAAAMRIANRLGAARLATIQEEGEEEEEGTSGGTRELGADEKALERQPLANRNDSAAEQS